MKAIRYIFVLGLYFFGSCKPSDPQANLLMGTWQATALRQSANTDWVIIGQGQKIAFLPNGFIKSSESLLFSGGWCNVAERYSLKDERIFFTFGEVKCIPIVNPNTPVSAKIISLTPQLLIFEWGELLLKFERP